MATLAEALLYRPAVRMSIPMKVMYVLLKNPTHTPVEFAQLFAEVSILDRASDAGPVLFSACKKAHKKHYPAFCFDALTEEEQRQYRVACFNKACPVCGDGVKADDTFCGPQCEEVSCSRCRGRLETCEVEKEVFDVERAVEMHHLGSILQAKGIMHPLPFEEQLYTYHPQCRSRVSCCMACDGCQAKHVQWFDHHLDFQTFGNEPLAFWLRREDRLEELHQLPETKKLASKETRCSRCGSEESGRPSLQRRRV